MKTLPTPGDIPNRLTTLGGLAPIEDDSPLEDCSQEDPGQRSHLLGSPLGAGHDGLNGSGGNHRDGLELVLADPDVDGCEDRIDALAGIRNTERGEVVVVASEQDARR